MAGRDGVKVNTHLRNAKVRRCGLAMGGALGAFVAAAAMATSSAAPAKADFEDLLDPIIQPILTQVTDSLAGLDPTLGTDLTTWTDTFLADLNSLDSATSASSTAVAAAASPAQSGTSYDIPITVAENTEPTVQATVDGADTTLLVDTGSSGLVIPYTDLGSNTLTQLENLIELGIPSGISSSGYSGGVDYVYLEYNDVPIDYGNGTLDTTGPVDVEIYSYNPDDLTSFFTNDAYQNFDTSNGVTGVLGIGDSADDAGPGTSPFEAAGYDNVAVDINSNGTSGDLIVDPTLGTPYATLDGAPTPTSTLTEVVTNGQTPVGTATVSDDIDSGGVYGTIPSSIGTVPNGDTITVEDSNGTALYSYTVENDGANQLPNESPTPVSGDDIDSGFSAFDGKTIDIDYSNDTISFYNDPLAE